MWNVDSNKKAFISLVFLSVFHFKYTSLSLVSYDSSFICFFFLWLLLFLLDIRPNKKLKMNINSEKRLFQS